MIVPVHSGIYVKNWVRFRIDRFFPDRAEVQIARRIHKRQSHAPELLALLEERRIQEGYECWTDTDGTDMIKTFMFEHRFRRVAPK